MNSNQPLSKKQVEWFANWAATNHPIVGRQVRTLEALASRGLVERKSEEFSSGPNHRGLRYYYEITEAGRRQLALRAQKV